MANKQQTALQTLIKWGDKMLKENPNKILSFSEVIDKAEELLQMEREKIETAYWEGGQDVPINENRCAEYYEQTYGTDKD